MSLPGQPGSTAPPAPDWIPRRIRQLEQQLDQLRGQLSGVLTSARLVAKVTVSGSTLIVTFTDGSTTTAQLP